MAEVKKNLNPFLVAQHATEVRQGLTQLFGELGRHLQAEAKDPDGKADLVYRDKDGKLTVAGCACKRLA